MVLSVCANASGQSSANHVRPPLLDQAALRARSAALDRLILPEVEFENVPVPEAVASLERRSAELGEGGGLRVSLAPEIDPAARIRLRLREVPWSEALRYVCALVSAQVTMGEGGLVLIPTSGTPEFSIEVLALDEAARRFVSATRQRGATIAEALAQAGVPMPLGSSAVYNPATGQLIVRHHPEGHRQVKGWLAKGK
jgi:hypothetical protein